MKKMLMEVYTGLRPYVSTGIQIIKWLSDNKPEANKTCIKDLESQLSRLKENLKSVVGSEDTPHLQQARKELEKILQKVVIKLEELKEKPWPTDDSPDKVLRNLSSSLETAIKDFSLALTIDTNNMVRSLVETLKMNKDKPDDQVDTSGRKTMDQCKLYLQNLFIMS